MTRCRDGRGINSSRERVLTLKPGQTLAHYRIERLIGQGGMGAVFLAEDMKLERKVALKVLPPEMASSAERLERFQREAKAVAALNHPHIVTLFSIEEAGGSHFLTMELVEGSSLDQALPPGGLPLARVFDIGIALADALAAAHEKGIIHRDLKPSNVMVPRDGRVKVLDFGLAKLATQPVLGSSPPGAGLSEMATRDRSLTGTGVVTGTVPYMSPEQVQARQVDARTDVFSLGVVLYEMTTGRRPFGGGSPAETMSSVLRDAPRPVTEARADAPRQLARIIDHCLEKEPDARFQTAKDVRNELRALREEIGSAGAAPVGPPGSAVASGSKAGVGRWIAAGAGVALIAVAATVWIGRGALWPRGDIAPPDPGTGALKKAPVAPAVVAGTSSIAVLPFENLSGDPEQKYFAEGMTEALITELSRFSALRVVSRTSVMRYENTLASLPEIGRELQVDVVVEGSVLKAGGRVRVTAQLIDAKAPHEVRWAENYDRELRDILALHSEVARAIAREVQVAMTPAEESRLAEARQIDPEAYEEYLRGRYHFNRTSEAELDKAVGYFERALAKEPRYAAAYSGLADSYNRLGMTLVGRAPGDMRSKAIAAANEALRIDDRLAEAHVSLGWAKFFNWDWPGAEESFLRAMALNPNYAEAYQMYSLYLAALGRFDQAIATARRAVALDPLSVNSQARLGQVLFYARRYEEAIRELRNALELDPNFVIALVHLGDTYAKVSRYDEAISVLEKAATLSRRKPAVLGFLGCAYARAGRDLEARELQKDLTELSKTQYISPISLAWLDACLKDRESAFEWLEKAFAERSYLLVYLAVDPSIDSVRDDPRFRDLVRRMNLPGDAMGPS